MLLESFKEWYWKPKEYFRILLFLVVSALCNKTTGV